MLPGNRNVVAPQCSQCPKDSSVREPFYHWHPGHEDNDHDIDDHEDNDHDDNDHDDNDHDDNDYNSDDDDDNDYDSDDDVKYLNYGV